MKNIFLSCLLLTLSSLNFTAFSQTGNDQDLLGLPGDNLDLYAVLAIFQESKTIEDFEKALNEENTGINNLDLNKDDEVDFIKVETKQEGDDFLFILQDPISEKETQDIAVIIVSKDEDKKVTLQIVGDTDLYGKDYVIEPQTKPSPSITANPAYTGDAPVTENVAATTKVVVVESTPIVKYVYSPVYVPYHPPYYYGYYPPYFAAFTVVAIGVYRHNHYHYHHGYHNTVVIHNHNRYNHYHSNSRRNSVTVNNNIKYRNYNTSGRAGTRPSTTTRPTATRRPTTTTRPTGTTRPTATRRPTTTTRPTNNNYSSGSRSRSNYSSRSARPSSARSSSMGSRSRRR